MVARTLAGSLGLKGGWLLGEDNWKGGMDENLLWLSVAAQGRVLDQVLAEPGSPTEGMVYLLDAAHATRPNQIAAYDDGGWHYRTPESGWRFFNVATSLFLQFDGTVWVASAVSGDKNEYIHIALGDETTPTTAGAAKVTIRMPFAMVLSDVRGSLTTAQASGGVLTIDINEGGASILSTKLTFDNTEKTTATSSVPVVISDVNLADDAEITIDIDSLGDGTAAGAKVVLIGYRP